MASKLVLVVAAIAFTAVSAFPDAYSEDELSQISHEIDLCLRDLPSIGGGSFPVRIDVVCGDKAFNQLWGGATKEELTPTVVDCLKSFNVVSASRVSETQQCLTDRLSKPLNQSIDYSRAQKKEILSRIQKCLLLVPTYSQGRQPRDVCLARASQTLKDGAWKESLEDSTVTCLKNAEFSVSATVVAAAKTCLRKNLDADV